MAAESQPPAPGTLFYEWCVLAAMIKVLPEPANALLTGQLSKVGAKLTEMISTTHKSATDALDDLAIYMRYLEFDLEITKRERDALENNEATD